MNVWDSFYSLYCTVIPDSGFRIPGFRVARRFANVSVRQRPKTPFWLKIIVN